VLVSHKKYPFADDSVASLVWLVCVFMKNYPNAFEMIPGNLFDPSFVCRVVMGEISHFCVYNIRLLMPMCVRPFSACFIPTTCSLEYEKEMKNPEYRKGEETDRNRTQCSVQ
jgi:hypothetical protein